VADHGGHLAGLVEGGDERVHAFVAPEGVHRALASDEQRSVVVVDADVGKRLRFLDQLHVRGRVDETEADQILGRVAGLVARVAPRIGS
jgi:hypothetical protein